MPPACLPCVSAATTTPRSSGVWGYRSYRQHLAERFPGRRIRKLCLDAGFTCPNIRPDAGRHGCAYCNNAGFVPRAARSPDLEGQWDRGRAALRRRHRRVDGFIAYFQAFSNTHAGLDRLRALYDPLPDRFIECVGASISTRPDCLDDEVLDLLAEVARRTFLTLELGLQTDRDDLLARLGRGHDLACFLDAVRRAAGRGFELCAHFLLGLPGEGDDAPERLGRLAASLPIQSVKIHNLHVMAGTPLAEPFRQGLLGDLPRDRYLDMVARFVGHLRPDQAVQRLIADAPDRILLSAPWCHDKQAFLTDLAGRITGR